MTTRPAANLVRALLLLAALSLSACSTFERDWRASAARGVDAREPFAGAWDGKWTSSRHGSPGKPIGGRLRCIFTPAEAGGYRAHFKANWHGFATTYQVAVRTERRGNVLQFRGEQDLGALAGGVYRYEGRVTAGRFESSYDSKYDAGRFEMTRPAALR